MNEEKKYPDIIRCNNSNTVGPKSTWCKINEIKHGVAHIEIKKQHYIIPLKEIQYMIRNAEDKEAENKAP